jgi:hypothetical protein
MATSQLLQKRISIFLWCPPYLQQIKLTGYYAGFYDEHKNICALNKLTRSVNLPRFYKACSRAYLQVMLQACLEAFLMSQVTESRKAPTR